MNEHYPSVLTVMPEKCLDFVRENSDHGGSDVVLEVAGANFTFRLTWECAPKRNRHGCCALRQGVDSDSARQTGGDDGCDCEETLKLIAKSKLDTDPLITHTYPLAKIDEAYELFEEKRDGVFKVVVEF